MCHFSCDNHKHDDQKDLVKAIDATLVALDVSTDFKPLFVAEERIRRCRWRGKKAIK